MAKRLQSDQSKRHELNEKRLEELIMIIGGSASMDHKGLLQRQREDERLREEFRLTVIKKFDELSKKMDKNFDTMEDHFDARFKTIEDRFKKIEEWKLKIDVYLGLLSHKTVLKALGIIGICCVGYLLAFAGGAKGLYNLIMEYIKNRLVE